MKSMTAFAQVPFSMKSRRYRLEIQSLNKKGLDLTLDLPSSLLSLNIPIRLFVSSKIERGSIFVRLKEDSQDRLPINEHDITSLKTKLVELAYKSGYNADSISFGMILDKANLLQPQDIEMSELEPHLNHCIDALIKMRQEEGSRLKKDFQTRFHYVSTTLEQIESIQKAAPEKIKQSLIDRLKQLEMSGVDEERLMKEVIYYVEKQDVTEELTRLKSHMVQMNELLNSKEAVGRKLEFITQECFRELNTLCAKTSEIEVINKTLLLKNEFEKIKEQVMNIE